MIGRICHFYEALAGGFNRPELLEKHLGTVQPQAAIITYVHPKTDDAPQMVNVVRFSADGMPIPHRDVPLLLDDSLPPTHGGWAVPPEGWHEHMAGKLEADRKQRDAATKTYLGETEVDPDADKTT